MSRRATKVNPGRSMGFMPSPADIARLVGRVVPVQHDGVDGQCWEWQGPLDSQGYGSIKIRGTRYFVHRASFSIFKDDAATDHMQVDHQCLNRRCCNPAHLVAKPHGQNAAEANDRRWTAFRAAKAAQRETAEPSLPIREPAYCEAPF